MAKNRNIKKKVLIVYFNFFSSSLLFIPLAAYLSAWLVLPFFLTPFIHGIVLRTIRCPRCAKWVLRRKEKVFGTKTEIIHYWPDKNCHFCGESLE